MTGLHLDCGSSQTLAGKGLFPSLEAAPASDVGWRGALQSCPELSVQYRGRLFNLQNFQIDSSRRDLDDCHVPHLFP